MRNVMLLTLSSSRSRPLGVVWCFLMAVVVGLLGGSPVVADASDWLPLEVGNEWTYEHEFYDYEQNYDGDWSNFKAPYGVPQFTISVLRTEVIDGHTYFVMSDMPERWPPPPSFFIAGKKLRWAGDHLMERTASGEQVLYRFGRIAGAASASGARGASYAFATQEGTNQVSKKEKDNHYSHEYDFTFEHDAGPELEGDYEGGGSVFLKGFGIRSCGFATGNGDETFFNNILGATHAVLGGRTVTVDQARKASVTGSQSSEETSIQWSSWGLIKQ